jgi:hypothetical protein
MTLVRYGDGVPDSALIMLAGLILQRVRLNLPNATRTQALAIIKGVKTPPSKDKPLVKSTSFRRMSDPCSKCGKPVYYGEPCVCYEQKASTHIACVDKVNSKLYDACVFYVDNVINNPNAEK